MVDQHHLGVSNFSRTIKKEPPTASPGTLQPTATRATAAAAPLHVYNISKSDFRSFVQQMTGTDDADRHSRPRPTARLRQNRPPPLAAAPPAAPNVPAESPVSAYMRHLESTLLLHSDGSTNRGLLSPLYQQLPPPPPAATAASPSGFYFSPEWNDM